MGEIGALWQAMNAAWEKLAELEQEQTDLADKVQRQKDRLLDLKQRLKNLEAQYYPDSEYIVGDIPPQPPGRAGTWGQETFVPVHQVQKQRRSPAAQRLATLSAASASPAGEAVFGANALPAMAKAYNELTTGGSLQIREARQDFLRRYKVEGFACTNYEARMSAPQLAPAFHSSEPVLQADYWAVPLGNNGFAVMPNPKLTYDETHHGVGGMGYAFRSNYQQGSTYQSIKVNNPAIFLKLGQNWQLRKAGRLELR